jgi:hypothetical protein
MAAKELPNVAVRLNRAAREQLASQHTLTIKVGLHPTTNTLYIGKETIRAGNLGQTIGMIARVLGDMDRELHRGRTGR